MDSCMNRYANWCKLKVEMSMHHAYDKSWKTMGDISNYNVQTWDVMGHSWIPTIKSGFVRKWGIPHFDPFCIAI